MADHSKVFTYEEDGLSYSVTMYEEGGEFFADITVIDGAMDVNAVYFGDDDFSGKSEMLKGPLNMKGARHGEEDVQWDNAVALSNPGLGPEGEDKDTYLTSGDTLTLSLDIDSLDEIDVFGIRATSTTTEEGSIKAVTGDPEEPEEPEEPIFEKIFFGEEFSESGDPLGGTFILDEEPYPNTYDNVALPEGTEPTFENYLDYFLSDEVGGDLSSIESIVFYGFNDDGNPEEQFQIDAPDGGFQDAEDVLAAYDDAISGYEESQTSVQTIDNEADANGGNVDDVSQSYVGEELIAAISMEEVDEAEAEQASDVEEDEFELLL